LPTHVLVLDGLGVALALAGFHLAFRQRQLRAWLESRRRRRGLPPSEPSPAGQDPLVYVLRISGTMLMAFGIILVGFTTMYALASRA
jgi:hypothetical protein